ncbi:peptide/nickel transport system ATP-binding protein/oligopeptide transport system ATP-binding protein [Fictibacillus halophilus]|uniref:Peptide/nickel transport system ATP-binding protein/oligopeptide transport system ATP-binding protein n=1 Tax=Fictibacillus halophilus TaxID=1610490 RepID=A0ABV2LRP0_9BACL|nr:ABC transporter ATP-binding protein [Fictibacillus halophilus]
MSNRLLEINNLNISFGSGKNVFNAVTDISLSVSTGQTAALIGESGSGKSVTSLSVLKLLPANGRAESGSIRFDDKEILQMTEKEMQKIRGNEISMIFQDAIASLNPAMKVGVQITEGLKYHKQMPKSELRTVALTLLEQVGFHNPAHIFDQYPSQLSGGMKQRILIAMAISCRPKLIIADEPTTALDVTIQRQVLDLIADYKIREDASVLMITHDFGVVAEYADWVYVMFGGRIVESGDVFTIFNNPIHPYTKGLIGCIPSLESDGDRLKSVYDYSFEEAGYKGRKFAPETYSMESKVYHAPSSLIEVEPGHYVRLFDESEVTIVG